MLLEMYFRDEDVYGGDKGNPWYNKEYLIYLIEEIV